MLGAKCDVCYTSIFVSFIKLVKMLKWYCGFHSVHVSGTSLFMYCVIMHFFLFHFISWGKNHKKKYNNLFHMCFMIIYYNYLWNCWKVSSFCLYIVKRYFFFKLLVRGQYLEKNKSVKEPWSCFEHLKQTYSYTPTCFTSPCFLCSVFTSYMMTKYLVIFKNIIRTSNLFDRIILTGDEEKIMVILFWYMYC